MKKRPFVLLEILIAFALVSTSVLPFLHFPFKHMQKEIDTLFEMELERIAQNELASLLQQIYRKEVSEKVLFSEKREKLQSSKNLTVELSPKIKRHYVMHSSIYNKKMKEVDPQSLAALIECKVVFTDPKKRTKTLKAHINTIAQKKI